MRVHPILDWSYFDVWSFFINYGLHYCQIYDEGYSSLGEIHNTQKNPYLRQLGDDELEVYEPAYKLRDGDHERYSRRDPKDSKK